MRLDGVTHLTAINETLIINYKLLTIMKKIFTFFSAYICAMSMFALTYNVTVPAGTKACYIAGEMNGWSQVEMTKVDDTHYTLDVADATDAMKYKYCSGPSWAYVEKTADGSEVADRTYAAEDVVEAWAAVYDPTNVPEPGEAKDITVKAKVPAEWTDQITAWVWPTGGAGTEVVPTQEGEWYVVTHNCAELNIIFKNGAGWNGDANQTVDITVTESTCIEITAGTGKANYTAVNCEGGETPNPGEPQDITVKAKVPATWTDQITAWVWPTGGAGEEVIPTQDGDWYVVTHNCTELNIIFKNGAGWNGDANQTVDMTFTENTCIEIAAGSGKATYTNVDCPSGETPELGTLTYNVTVPEGTLVCYIAGEMTSWSHTEMTKVDDTHYTISIENAAKSMPYKYCSGPGWDYVEKTMDGEEIADRSYSEYDVVEAWANIYDPNNVPPVGEPKDITVKAKVPAEWTDQITAWVWHTEETGKEVIPTQEGEWYVVSEFCSAIYVIFKNGAGWNGNTNQTVDMTFTENTCVEITAGEGKATYTVVDCPETTDVENVTVEGKNNKFILNGQLVILRDGIFYNAMGQEVK